jgi:hypothetical protein
MNWDKFQTYEAGYKSAFETFCTQLFERYLKREFSDSLTNYQIINGAGGDGGIEGYGQLKNGEVIAIQAKWFLRPLKSGEFNKIRESITTVNIRSHWG